MMTLGYSQPHYNVHRVIAGNMCVCVLGSIAVLTDNKKGRGETEGQEERGRKAAKEVKTQRTNQRTDREKRLSQGGSIWRALSKIDCGQSEWNKAGMVITPSRYHSTNTHTYSLSQLAPSSPLAVWYTHQLPEMIVLHTLDRAPIQLYCVTEG